MHEFVWDFHLEQFQWTRRYTITLILAQCQWVGWRRVVPRCRWYSNDYRRGSSVASLSSSSVRSVTSQSSLPSSSALSLSGHVTSVVLRTPGRRRGSPPRWPFHRVAGAARRPAALTTCRPSPPLSCRRPSNRSSRCRPRRRAASAARWRHRPDIGSVERGGRRGDGTSCGT